jgi:hypothetical protein
MENGKPAPEGIHAFQTQCMVRETINMLTFHDWSFATHSNPATSEEITEQAESIFDVSCTPGDANR